MDYDVVIVGAGVVGLACAERLTRAGLHVLVLERHASFGRETSSRSSEVVHAGMYYATGSLKARMCVAGNASVFAWCRAHGVAFARVGKHIVATAPDEDAKLDDILARGLANGVVGLERVSLARLQAAEPNVVAAGALLSAHTGIVDSHAFMASLLAVARAAPRGCDVAFRHSLVGVAPRAGGYALAVRDDTDARAVVQTRAVVNAAGLGSDEVAALAGIDVDAAGYRLTYVKGRYVRLHRRGFVRGLVYPVPPPRLIGLGIHVTVELDGGVRLGPDVDVLPDRRIAYDVPESVIEPFFAAASRYLRGLRRGDLTPDQAGVRPKLAPIGDAAADFVVREESARGLPRWVNLIGIESPGLTSSLEIAAEVARLLDADRARSPAPA